MFALPFANLDELLAKTPRLANSKKAMPVGSSRSQPEPGLEGA
jgi:hypothetical protein